MLSSFSFNMPNAMLGGIIDPRDRPTVMACSDHCFCTLFKTKQISSENNVPTG